MPEHGTRLLTISEAAEELGVHQKTLRSWADRGLIAHYRTPTGYRRFDPEEIERFKDEMRVEVEGKELAA
jgi:excisionase family DNA binding protein